MPTYKINYKPLVSVIVATFNSSRTVVETLESIKDQSYENIELIITDDCSEDDTISICRKWVENNRSRFCRTEVITVNKNLGIPANCNRGLKKASGEWIKYIAGDDKLKETAIRDVIEFVTGNSQVEVLDSVVEIYNDDFSRKVGTYNYGDKDFHHEKVTSLDQRKMFVNALFGSRIISTLGVFVKREVLVEVNGFDEKYHLLEDSPLWWKILKSNRKFYFLEKPTTCYRRHEKAVSYNRKLDYNKFIVSNFQITVLDFMQSSLMKDTTGINKLNIVWIRCFYQIIARLGNKGRAAMYIYKFALFTQPLRITSKLKAMLNKVSSL